ncbi:hypothetical protein AA0119_g11504 [Alternaria tenuissima]|nr:hypothetical protein AA0119_g11504 [Alternaria tenuissima]
MAKTNGTESKVSINSRRALQRQGFYQHTIPMAELPSKTQNYEEQRFEKHEPGSPLSNESSSKNVQHPTPEGHNTTGIIGLPNELVYALEPHLDYQENRAFYSTCKRLMSLFMTPEFSSNWKELDHPELDEETLKNIVHSLDKQKWTYALFLEKGLSTLSKPKLLHILLDAAELMLKDPQMKRHHKPFTMRVPWKRKSMPDSKFVNGKRQFQSNCKLLEKLLHRMQSE